MNWPIRLSDSARRICTISRSDPIGTKTDPGGRYRTSYALRTCEDGARVGHLWTDHNDAAGCGRPMKLVVTKSGAACGAEIACDLAQDIDEAKFWEIERAFHDNIVVVFERQNLSNERHIEFSRLFGELEIHIVRKYVLPGFPEILLISNIRDDRGEHIGLADAGFTWHSDTSYRRRPSRCSLLYAKEVPQRDGRPLGDTGFANAIAAYEALPESM